MKQSDTQKAADLSFDSVGINVPTHIQWDLLGSALPEAEGLTHWEPDEGGLVTGLAGGNVHLNHGFEVLVPRRCKNSSGVDIKNGNLVYIISGDGINVNVALADYSAEGTSAVIIGMATEDIDDGSQGWVTTYGLVRGDALQPINTNAHAPGTTLYLGAAGAFTATKPSAPNHLCVIGTVFRQHATEGIVLVHISNGFELSELHDVLLDAPASIADNEVLAWDSASSLWKNQTAAEAGLVGGTGTAGYAAGWATATTLGTSITRQLLVDGSADETVARFQAHSTMAATSHLTTWESSAGATLFYVNKDGKPTLKNNISFNGEDTIGVARTLLYIDGNNFARYGSTALVDCYFDVGGITGALIIKGTTGRFSLGAGASPSAKLHVKGSQDVAQAIIQANATQSAASYMLSIQNSSSTAQVYITGDFVTVTNGRRKAVATKSANYTLTANDEVVVFTASATATLPAASGSGQWFSIGCVAGTVTLDGNSTDTINGELTQTINSGENLQVVDYAANKWIVI